MIIEYLSYGYHINSKIVMMQVRLYMKNKQKSIITISITILLIIGVIGIIAVKISKNNKENWITDNEQLY